MPPYHRDVAFRLPRHARLVRFPSTDGLVLEGRLTPEDPARAVVLCHPHPLYGGSMLTPVILTAEEAFRDAGYSTLAFNFRGVGASEGAHGEGRAEVADVAGALDFLPDALGGEPVVRAVAGYSFGSAVGAQVAAADPRVTWYLGIAPIVNRWDFGFLRAARCRLAFIGGTRDEHGDAARLRALVATLPGEPWLRILDADHFFTDALPALAAACGEAIAWAAGGGGGPTAGAAAPG
jgi:alpha/beta superfamily hydrolase